MAGSSGEDGDVPSPRPPTDLSWAQTVTSVPYGHESGGPGLTAAASREARGAQTAPLAAGTGSTEPAQEPVVQQQVVQQQVVQQPVQQVIRHGPGVPATVPSAQTAPSAQEAPTAEQVWRDGLPPGSPPRRRARQIVSLGISVALLAASGVVIFLRLYHGSFGVTGVAITQQTKVGCTVDVTGRIDTTGAAGTVSYQWVFQPQFAAPQPLSQSVAAGQSAVYVTAAVEGHGHGTLAQTAALQVLGPGPGRAAQARVVISC
jgi:hypothetical protein